MLGAGVWWGWVGNVQKECRVLSRCLHWVNSATMLFWVIIVKQGWVSSKSKVVWFMCGLWSSGVLGLGWLWQ